MRRYPLLHPLLLSPLPLLRNILLLWLGTLLLSQTLQQLRPLRQRSDRRTLLPLSDQGYFWGHFGYFGTVIESFPDLWRFETDQNPRIRTTGLRIQILLFSSVAFKMPTKYKIKFSKIRSEMFIPDLFFHPGSRIRIPDPEVKKAPDPGCGSATLNTTGYQYTN
jgi:hypothetical protein